MADPIYIPFGGSAQPSDPEYTISTVTTGPYLASAGEYIRADASAGSFTINLPAAPADGVKVAVKKIDAPAFVVTLSGNGNTIDGAASWPLNLQYDNLTVIYDGTEWGIV